MKYDNDELDAHFTIPDSLSIRHQLQYKRAINRAFIGELTSGSDGDFYPLFLAGAKTVIEDWQCEHVPDLDGLNFDEVTNPRVADVVFWTCNTVAGHMNRLEEVPKNS